jgi:uncharacterized protein (TIGR02271 family)
MADAQTRTSSTIVGYFDNFSDAQDAVDNLKDAGFTASQIGFARRSYNDAESHGAGRTATAKAGAAGESVWDKVKNFFEGGSVEPYADEKSRGDFANREVSETGSGYAQSGANNDSYEYGDDDFRESLSGLSVPEQQSRYFSQRFGSSESGAVVTVTAPGREEEAERILEKAGADLGNNAANYDYSSNAGAGARGETGAAGLRNIQLLGEVLRVHKDRVNRGEVRIRKDIITEQQTVQVPVTREELVVERMPVSGETAAQGQIGQDREIRIPLTEERAAVDKETVVREQVAVGKRAVENVRNVGGEVRREELVVEDSTKGGRTGMDRNLDRDPNVNPNSDPNRR